jgi:hypothetical protein
MTGEQLPVDRVDPNIVLDRDTVMQLLLVVEEQRNLLGQMVQNTTKVINEMNAQRRDDVAWLRRLQDRHDGIVSVVTSALRAGITPGGG